MHAPIAKGNAEELARTLKWKPAGNGWQLFAGKRRFGKVIPDSNHPGMWRTVLSGGRLSDTANLSWARSAVMEAAIREIEWEARQGKDPLNSQQNEGVFGAGLSQSDLNGEPQPDMPSLDANPSSRPQSEVGLDSSENNSGGEK